jgi:dolichol kinase
MATRLDDNGEPTTRKRGNGFAVATLVFGIVGLILGVVSPPALLLGLVAIVLGARTVGQGHGRPSPATFGMTVAGLLAGLVCLVLTLLFLTGFFEP